MTSATNTTCFLHGDVVLKRFFILFSGNWATWHLDISPVGSLCWLIREPLSRESIKKIVNNNMTNVFQLCQFLISWYFKHDITRSRKKIRVFYIWLYSVSFPVYWSIFCSLFSSNLSYQFIRATIFYFFSSKAV